MDRKVLSSGIQFSNLPESYVRPESERPRLSEVSECEDVPTVDLGSENRAQIVHQIGEACRFYGFFQVQRLAMCILWIIFLIKEIRFK